MTADFRKCKITFAQFRPTGVDVVENFYDFINAFLAGDSLHIHIDGTNSIEHIQPLYILRPIRSTLWRSKFFFDESTDSTFEKFSYINPCRIAIHFLWGVELKGFCFNIKIQIRECGRIALKERRRFSSENAI